MDWMKLPQPQPIRCASSRPRETGRLWIRRQLCTWYFNWHIETLETRVMSNMNGMVLALLAVTMTAVAQQPAAAPQNPQPVSATQPGQTAAQPSAAPSGQAQSAQSQSPQAQASLAPPTTMDQVVDRVIARENDLIKFLSPRTPIVETYLQNLTQDPQLGPIPQDDHYFLGRMDLSDSIDRSDYLQEKVKGEGEGMEKRLLS